MEVDFSFPSVTKYPCIPTRVDDDVDIYPLKGTSIITGIEYLMAKAMGCKIVVKNCIHVPFTKAPKEEYKTVNSLKEYLKHYIFPFRKIVDNLQQLRRAHPKKTFYNYMYKEIGNSIYGQIAMGLSGKNKFDVLSKSYKQVKGGFLTNPLLASYITGFTRALIAECLHNVNILGGEVVSTTTDGFICNIKDLEDKILDNPNTLKTLLLLYRELRTILTTQEKDESVKRPIKNEEDESSKILVEKEEEKEVVVDPRALEIKSSESDGLLS